MDLCEESPRSVVGHVGEVFPRKRAAQDSIEEGRQRCDSKVLPVVAAPTTQRGQYPVFPGHEEYLKNICSQTPANGNSIVRSYAGVSVPGYHDQVQMKQNQDRLIMFEDHATDSFVCACLDGHGVNGHKISQIFKREIEARLCSHPMFTANIEQAIHEVLAGIEFEMYRKEARLADYSGTTITLAVIRGRRVTVANIGDSRIIVGKRRRILHRQAHQQPADHFQHHHPMVIDAFPLSVDHKPHLPMEHARIVAAGGRVFSVRYEDGAIGPPRVWLGDANVPGLAMSRSLGDFVVHTAGVISRPDIFHYELHPEEDCYLIAATDGLWDYLQNQEVISLVHQATEPHHAITQLMHEVRQRWWKKERMLDDTTICVVQFQGSGNSRSSSTSSDGGRKSALDLLSPPTSCEASPVLTGGHHMSDI